MEKAMLMLPLMLYLMLPAPSMESRQSKTIPLSMAEQSVDDMYSGCTKEMAAKVKRKYLPSEMKNSLFKSAWGKAKSCANTKYKTRKDKALTKDHLQAICAYTSEQPKLYQPFNAAVRRGASKYATPAFQYHTLHFWLVSALEILRINKLCRITYRRSKEVFTGAVNQTIRFGAFTSTTKKANMTVFGKETCFHIRTCYGGYLKDYSVFGKSEREVLIPPYEKFRIMKIAKGSYQNMTDCNMIFVLMNAGPLSNLNCKAARNWRPIDN